MNNVTALDCFLYGALIGAGILATGGLCWALAYRGRKRWSAERRGDPVHLVMSNGEINPVAMPRSARNTTYKA